MHVRVVQGNVFPLLLTPESMTQDDIPNRFVELIYQVGCSKDRTSNLKHVMVAGDTDDSVHAYLSAMHPVPSKTTLDEYYLALDRVPCPERNHKRGAQAVIDLHMAQRVGLKCHQTF